MVADTMVRRIRRNGDNPALEQTSATWWSWRRTSSTMSPQAARLDDEGALGLTAFWRGIRLISDTLASLPVHVYENRPNGRSERVNDPTYNYLTRRPNFEMRKVAFLQRVFADLVRGNAFIFVDKNEDTEPESIWYLDRNRFKVGRASNGIKVYEVDGHLPMIDYSQGGEIVHISNFGNALVGYDPIKIATQVIALGLSAQEYVEHSFSNGQIPPGILTSEQVLTPQQADNIVAEWKKRHAGMLRAQDIAVLGSGATFTRMSVDHEKMQMEALRRFQVQEVARLLGIPPHLLADVDHASQGGANGVEELGRTLWYYTLLTYVALFEEAMSDDFLRRELTGRFLKLEPAGILRGSTLQRYQALRNADFMTVNEKRALEDLPPVEGGDQVLQQVNQAPMESFEGMQIGQGGAGQ